MKFKTGIKLGASIYIGWEIAKIIDEYLGKLIGESKTYCKLINRLSSREVDPEESDNEDTVKVKMGFH